VTIARRALSGTREEVNRVFNCCFAAWTPRQNDLFGFGDLIPLPSQRLDVMDKFHVLNLLGRTELTKVQAERIPVNTECIEGRPFVAMCDVAFECGAIDMVANSFFDLTRKAIMIDGD
jgi:hypothetical protein